MARKRKIDKPFNFGFTIMDNEFPRELHMNLGVPGIFKKQINKKVYLQDGSIGEMDASYLVDPDFERIFEPMAVNGEHQSTPVGEDKIKMIGYYGIQQIHEENVPQISYVASNISKEKHVQCYERSPSDFVKPMFIDLGPEDNKKRLSNVEDIINNQRIISDVDALNLGIIVLFAPRDIACEVTRKVVELYVRIADRLHRKMESTLYTVICTMIDAYFDDEEEYRRMMSMMNENTSYESTERFVSLDIFKNNLDDKVKELEEANGRIEELEEVNSRLEVENGRIKELEAENFELKKQLRNSK
ncbi:hypothetical protein [Methanobrevibacter sp.]